MRILILSREADGLGIAQRLAFEENHVDVWIADTRYKNAGRGLVNRVPSFQGVLSRADLIIADGVGLSRYEDIVRRTGRPAIGFSAALDKIELDRVAGIRLFENAEIETPETHAFASPAEALSIIKTQRFDDGWVIKPDGNKAAAKTSVCKHEMLLRHAIASLPPRSTGILQRCLTGIEVSTEGWFNGSQFVPPFNHTFEEKRFLNNDLGPNTGCAGNVVVNAGKGDRLVEATVKRVEPFLRLVGYRGPIDINCIVIPDGAFALEFTSRFGYDAIEALAEGLEEPLGDLLFGIAAGTKASMRLTDETMIAVRLSIPPYPHRQPDSDTPPEPVLGIDESTLHHLFLCDIERNGLNYATTNGDGILLKATAIGRVDRRPGAKPDYTYDARRRVYRLLDRIHVSGKQYRTDIGSRVNDDIAQLKKWGWLAP